MRIKVYALVVASIVSLSPVLPSNADVITGDEYNFSNARIADLASAPFNPGSGDGVIVGASLVNNNTGQVTIEETEVSGPLPGTNTVRAGPSPGAFFGTAVKRFIDCDGNGIDDVLVSAPGIATIYVFDPRNQLISGSASGNTLSWSRTGGSYGTDVALFPRPGTNNEWIAAVGSASSNKVYIEVIRKNATNCQLNPNTGGAPLAVITGPTSSEFGFSVADLGDLDDDGIDELGVGAHYYRVGTTNQSGGVWVYSGSSLGSASPTLLPTVTGGQPITGPGIEAGQQFGHSLDTAGFLFDLGPGMTGMGTRQAFVAGAPYRDNNSIMQWSDAGSASVYFYDNVHATPPVFRLLRELTYKETQANYGRDIASFGDLSKSANFQSAIAIGGDKAPVGASVFGKVDVRGGHDWYNYQNLGFINQFARVSNMVGEPNSYFGGRAARGGYLIDPVTGFPNSNGLLAASSSPAGNDKAVTAKLPEPIILANPGNPRGGAVRIGCMGDGTNGPGNVFWFATHFCYDPSAVSITEDPQCGSAGHAPCAGHIRIDSNTSSGTFPPNSVITCERGSKYNIPQKIDPNVPHSCLDYVDESSTEVVDISTDNTGQIISNNPQGGFEVNSFEVLDTGAHWIQCHLKSVNGVPVPAADAPWYQAFIYAGGTPSTGVCPP